MSNIFDIPQIPASPIENLQNDLHIGFGGDVAKRIQKVCWTDEKLYGSVAEAQTFEGELAFLNQFMTWAKDNTAWSTMASVVWFNAEEIFSS